MDDIAWETYWERTSDAMDAYEDEEDEFELEEDIELGCGDSFCDICGDPPDWDDEDDE